MTTEIRNRVDRLMLRYGLSAHAWSPQLEQELLALVHDAVMTEQRLCIEVLSEQAVVHTQEGFPSVAASLHYVGDLVKQRHRFVFQEGRHKEAPCEELRLVAG